MITGAHIIINSTKLEVDRAFFLDVLKLRHVDVGHESIGTFYMLLSLWGIKN